ncbi:MAG: magnesium transporter CorA family protein [Gallionellaceae bacterium]|nr:magnesium transporter CorA family protein [Gallionellaceae bacterium]
MDILLLASVNGAPSRMLDHIAACPEEGFVWLDFTREREPNWAETVERLCGVRLHEGHVRDSLNPAHPSFFDSTGDYDMVIFRGLAPEMEDEQFSTHPIAFFLFDRLLVTVQPGESRSLKWVKERLLSQSGRVPSDPAALMHMVLNAMVDRFLALREPLTEHMEVWVDRLLDPRNRFSEWYQVMGHRSQLRRLEILCDEQEDAIVTWRNSSRLEVGENLYVRYTDLLEHIRRVAKFASSQQHEVEGLVQLHFSAVAHRTNEIMRVLTVLSAIFLPLTLVAGIYGMNFEYIPELHTRYGYFVTLGGMLSLSALLLGWFRWKKWY